MDEDWGHILLYDGVCILCSRLVGFVIAHDRKDRFRFAALQSEKGQELLRRFGLPRNDLDSFVYIRGNRYFLRSTGVLRVVKELSWPWNWLYLLIVFPLPLRDWVYRKVSSSRYQIFGKRDHCIAPQPRLSRKFLDWEFPGPSSGSDPQENSPS
ncbi:MAG TPA: DCC1-like thiol-disulfide oxidoreductase family protein [Chitinophagaceae bacterium]|nr:DCC1-like thiol-disulfide oxidoreductase family protein [Chitinophagaceae bacterium]